MGLTREERDFILEALEQYPAGIPKGAWGFGPMMAADRYPYDSTAHRSPHYFAWGVIEEFG